MQIERITTITDEIMSAFERLLPQLSRARLPSRAELADLVASPACSLLIARDPDEIVGTLTLATFRTPTGFHAWIEDVVVDTAVRGRGIGEALTRAALERAHELGAHEVNLTSRPSREAANRLYQRIGFQLRNTNVYRYDLEHE